MSEQKWTAGPWTRTVSRGQSAAYTRVGAGDFGAVAECGHMRPSQEENAANARLIAAAPEMVTLLMEHLDCQIDEHCSFTRQARALLARINGEGK